MVGASAKALAVLLQLGSIGIAARSMGAGEFGLMTVLIGYLAVSAVVDLGIGNGVLMKLSYSLANDDLQEARRAVGSGLLTLAIAATVIAGCVAMTLAVVSADSMFPTISVTADEVTQGIGIFAALVLLGVPFTIGSKIAAAKRLVWSNALTLVLSSGLTFTVCLLASTYQVGLGVYIGAFAGGPTAAGVIQTVYLLASDRSLIPRLPDFGSRDVLAATRAGFPFLVLSGAGIIAYQSNALIIAHILGAAAAATFAILARLFNIVLTVLDVGNQRLWGALARRFSLGAREEAASDVKRAVWLSLIVTTPMCAILVALGPEIVSVWVGDQYQADLTVRLLMACWVLYNAVAATFSILLFAQGRAARLAVAGSIMTIISLTLAVWLTRRVGIAGPPLANLIAHVVIVGPLMVFEGRRFLGRSVPQESGEHERGQA